MIKHLLKILLLLPAQLAYLNSALAAQQVTVATGDMGVAKVSASDPTRLSIEGGRIVRLLGGEGKVTGFPDEDTGDTYIKPTPAYQSRPFSLFIKDDQSRVIRLLLTPIDGPAEDIVLRHADRIGSINKNERAGDYGVAKDWETLHSYEKAITQLVHGMVIRTPPRGYGKVDIERRIALWRETEVALLHRYQGVRLVGEIYSLKNTSDKTLNFMEQEFYRSGVLAVSLDKLILQPGESSDLYIVSAASVGSEVHNDK